MKVLCPEV